jgi:hypothetical protein
MYFFVTLFFIIAALTGPMAATAAAEPKPAEKKAETQKKTKKKKPKEVQEPADTSPAVESTKIEPYVLYRIGALKPVVESVYHKDDHGDLADQVYLTLKYTRTYNYVHRVHIEPSFRTLRNNPATWEDFIVEQAFIETELFSPLLVTAGKKTEYEGSGFIVNPSDLLNENKDIFDPVYQNEGVVFTRFKLRTDAFSLGLGYIPRRGQPSNEGRFWGQFSTEFFEVDLRLQFTGHQSDKGTTGVSVQRFFGGSFELHFDGRYQARQRSPESEGNSYTKYSAYSGANPNSQSDDTASGYYLGGTRFVFTPRRTLVLEYISNQSGLLPEEFKNFFGDLREDRDERIRDPQTKLLGRHYGFFSFQDDDTLKSTHLALNVLVNTDDQSSFVSAAARYYVSPITSVELAPTIFKGEADTEFGEMPFAHAVYLVFRGRF